MFYDAEVARDLMPRWILYWIILSTLGIVYGKTDNDVLGSEYQSLDRLDNRDIGDLLAFQLLNASRAYFLIRKHDFRVLWNNIAAVNLVESDSWLVISGHAVAASNKTFQKQLYTLLNLPEGGAVVLPPKGEKSALVLRALPVVNEHGDCYVSLSAYSPSATSQFIMPALNDVYNLTKSEARVLDHLVRGLTADGLAKELTITIETARTHIRRIYAKMGVSSREQLISRANGYRVP